MRKPRIFNLDKAREASAGSWTCSSERGRELGWAPSPDRRPHGPNHRLVPRTGLAVTGLAGDVGNLAATRHPRRFSISSADIMNGGVDPDRGLFEHSPCNFFAKSAG